MLSSIGIQQISGTDLTLALSGVFIETETYTMTAKNIAVGNTLGWYCTPTTSVTCTTAGGGVYTLGTQLPASILSFVNFEFPSLPQCYEITLYDYTSTGNGLTSSTNYSPLNYCINFPVTSVKILGDLNNERFIRTLRLSAVENSSFRTMGNEFQLRWTLLTPTNNIYNAVDKNGNDYVFGTLKSSYAAETIVLYLTTPTFDTNPNLYEYSIRVQAVSGNTIYEDAYTFEIDDFPSSAIFLPNFKLFNEDISVLDEAYRALNTYTTPNSAIFCNNSLMVSAVTGCSVFKFDDGQDQVTDFPDLSVKKLFDSSAYCTSSVYLICSAISATGWLYPHTAETDVMSIIFANQPVAEFIGWPDYTWDSGITMFNQNTETNYTNTEGLSVYGNGSVQYIYLSAKTVAGVNYFWTISSDIYDYNTPTATHVMNTPETTVVYPISLKLYNAELPNTTYVYHTADDGTPEYYSFYSITSTGNTPLFQNLTSFDYGSNIYITILNTPSALITENTTITATLSTQTFLPISLQENSIHYWGLSSTNWSLSAKRFNNNPMVTFRVSAGNGFDIGTVSNGIISNLYLTLTTIALANINYSPYRWAPVRTTIVETPIKIEVSTLIPTLYLTNKYNLTGENIKIQNVTVSSNEISGFNYTILNYLSANTSDYSSVTANIIKDGSYTITMTLTASNLYHYDYTDVVKVLAEYTEYNSDVNRIFTRTETRLPHSKDNTLIPFNEFLTSENINKSFEKLKENFDYLDNISKMYDPPPTEFYGWLGENNLGDNWRVNIDNINGEYLLPNRAVSSTKYSNIKDIIINNDLLYIITPTAIKILSDNYTADLISERTYKTIGDSFVDLRAIALDDRKRIYVLDSIKNKVMVFEDYFVYGYWKFLYEWGGIGGQNAKTRFRNPNDLYLHTDNTVWITDTDNKCIKKYSRTGTWLLTITNEFFTDDIKPLSMTIDSDENIHILTKNYVVKCDILGNFIKKYVIQNNTSNCQSIEKNVDNGFLYVCYSDKIIKINNNGDYAGTFGNEFTNTYNFYRCYHDTHRNLFITNNYQILKYIDKLDLRTIRLETTNYEWAMSAIYLNKDEYNQDWVLNKSFARYWDNLELFRRSITGKPILIYSDSDKSYRVSITNHSPTEWHNFIYNKNDIFIGINELVTTDVINRCFGMLWECQNYLLSLLA